MDDTLLFIPPCCVSNKLPKAVMQSPGRCLTFYTHGDVTMEQFYRAVAFMVDRPMVMALDMPTMADETVMFLASCMEKEEVTDMVITCGNMPTAARDRYFAPFAKRMMMSHKAETKYAQHMVLFNHNKGLILTGPMLARSGQSGLSQYTLQFLATHSLSTSQLDWGNALRNVLFPDALRMRQEYRFDSVESAALRRFLKMDFPPYKEDDQ